MQQSIGVLTSGGDCPGLNAAIRGLGKAAIEAFQMSVVGFRDGFRGLVQDGVLRVSGDGLAGILTDGGTILGTSRDKPHRHSCAIATARIGHRGEPLAKGQCHRGGPTESRIESSESG